MPCEYYNPKLSKEDPLESMSVKLPLSTRRGLRKIADHGRRHVSFVVREHLIQFVIEELRRLNLDGDERGSSSAAATRRKAS